MTREDQYNFEKEMKAIYIIRDASVDLYEALLAIKKAFDRDGGRCPFDKEEAHAMELMRKALELAERKD